MVGMLTEMASAVLRWREPGLHSRIPPQFCRASDDVPAEGVGDGHAVAVARAGRGSGPLREINSSSSRRQAMR
jgi:hypothetical protein